MRNAGRILIFLAGATLFGCGRDATPRHPLTGTVTFQGKPVEMGSIRFTADASVGNVVPGCFVQIVNGKYASKPEESPTTGKYQVQVMGIDVEHAVLNPPPGTPPELPALFLPFSTTVDVPPPDGTFNIDIPKSQVLPRR